MLLHRLLKTSETYITLIPWECRKSQTAISKFKGTRKESIQVLLLLVQHGANGLNLLEAQHVVLVEPLLNPATEAQAVGRVHRIGQDKPTLVHRFLVRASALFLVQLHFDLDISLFFWWGLGNGYSGRQHLQAEQEQERKRKLI